jgi:hypothetical protein
MVTKFEVSIIKDQYLFLMLGIYDDFDDDLLYDAVDLLTTWSDSFTPILDFMHFKLNLTIQRSWSDCLHIKEYINFEKRKRIKDEAESSSSSIRIIFMIDFVNFCEE